VAVSFYFDWEDKQGWLFLTPTLSQCSFKEVGVDSLHFNVQFCLMIGRRVKSLIKLQGVLQLGVQFSFACHQ
jgi:hypothetical protein